MVTRKLKPIRISPTALDAKKKVVMTVTEYFFNQTWGTDNVIGTIDKGGYPYSIGLNSSSLQFLMLHGINVTTIEGCEDLVGHTLTFEIQRGGTYPYYIVTKVKKVGGK